MKRVPKPFPLFLPAETALLSLWALLLCRSPLTGAFAYEFSFLLGIAAALVATGGSAWRLSKIRAARPLTISDRLRPLPANAFSLLGPIAVVLLFSFRIPTCRWDVGWAWFALLPLVSSIFGASCGIWAQRFRGTSVKLVLISFIPTFAFSLLTARDLYFGPSLSFLHPAFGFFAGPIYDEWIPIRVPIVTFRLFTIALSAWLIVLSLPGQRRWIHWLLTIGVLVPLLHRGPIGWFPGKEALERELSALVEGSHVVLRYAPGSLSVAQSYKLVALLDARAEQIADEIRLEPKEVVKRIAIYLYPDPATKFRLTGTRFTAIGNPVARTIHALSSDPPELLNHELAHVVAAPMGIPGLGLSLRIGLLEGFATAEEGYRDNLSVHEWARAMQQLHLLPRMESLFELSGFWGQSAGRAYLSAGSFVRWLIDTRGAHAFRKVYRGADFEQTYDIPLDDLVAEWEDFLRRIPLSPNAAKIAELELRRKPISERRCPHDVADALESGYGCWAKRDVPGTIENFERAWNYSGQTPSTSLRLARFEARSQNWDRVRALANSVLSNNLSSNAERTWAHLLLGNMEAMRGDPAQACMEYLKPPLDGLEENLRLLLETQIELCRLSRTKELQQLIANGADNVWAVALLALPDDIHLDATFLFASRKTLDSGDSLNAARLLSRSTGVPAGFEWFRLKLEAEISERQRDFRASRKAYESIRDNATTEGLRIFAQEQLARVNAER